jgi:hypothetical protein
MSNKLKIKLYDTNFSHLPDGSSSSSFPGYNNIPKNFDWVRDPDFESDFAFFTENCFHLVDTCKSKYKFGFILEPHPLIPNVRPYISNPEIYNKFTKVITCDKSLIDLDLNKFSQYVHGGCWIKPEDQKIYPKTKNVCIIASYKRFLPGHNLRHEIISKLASKHNIDVYGNGYRPFDQTVDILKNYRYCIDVENCPEEPLWFAEKSIQTIRTGGISIYTGSPFNDKVLLNDKYGFYRFSGIDGLDRLLPLMTKELYEFHLEKNDILDNFTYAERFTVREDWIFDFILHPWLEENNINWCNYKP